MQDLQLRSGIVERDDDPDWDDLLFLAKLIWRILHNINRMCFIFGGSVEFPITDITDTRLDQNTLEQLPEATHSKYGE